MRRPVVLVVCLLTAGCISATTERSGTIVSTGAPIASGVEVWDPYIQDYVYLPDGSAQVTYYNERVTTTGLLVLVQPLCGTGRHPYPVDGPYPRDQRDGPRRGPVSTSTVTINCR